MLNCFCRALKFLGQDNTLLFPSAGAQHEPGAGWGPSQKHMVLEVLLEAPEGGWRNSTCLAVEMILASPPQVPAPHPQLAEKQERYQQVNPPNLRGHTRNPPLRPVLRSVMPSSSKMHLQWGMVVHTCNPGTQQVWSRRILSSRCLKKKKKKTNWGGSRL
jgi:hypothetical protein